MDVLATLSDTEEMSVMRVVIHHYDDKKMKGTPVVFRGRAWRTAWRYLAFLDERKTKLMFEEMGKVWEKLP